MVMKLMSADDALSGMSAKLAAKGLPSGIIQAILDALMGIFKSFCPAMAPQTSALKATARDGLSAFESDQPTAARIHLRRALRRHLGFFSRRVDEAEGACWEIGAETPDDEIERYARAWQANRDSLSDSD